MATPAFIQFDSSNPVGTQTGPNAIVSMLNNLLALRTSLLSGKVKDFVFERANGTGTADNPQFFLLQKCHHLYLVPCDEYMDSGRTDLANLGLV